jgi:hypothetical protein
MAVRRLTLVFFAATTLFSMVREWSAPVACARALAIPSIATQNLR